jgi:hypothetical protein
MGAWGDGAFQNDAALDWLATLEAQGVEPLRAALASVAGTSEERYLDVDDGSIAIAAATVVACARGHAPGETNKRAMSAIAATAVTADDEAMARRAVRRVLGKNSELRSLYEGVPGWSGRMRALLDQLGAKT